MTETGPLEPADAPAVADLFDEYAWFAGRDAATVRRALAETDVAIGCWDGGQLVAAARVLTDYTYYATVYDVIVAADRRRGGVGETLLRAVRDHPALQDLPGLTLYCRRGLVPFYESVGFERFGREVDVPAGGTETLVRMTSRFDDEVD